MSERPLVLVVDDDQPILLLMRTLLREFGFEPVTAAGGQEALEEAARRPPALILVDRNMPGMSGDEVIAELRRTPTLASVPILIVSGAPMHPSEVERIGATRAVLKPFDVPGLVAEIRELVARG